MPAIPSDSPADAARIVALSSAVPRTAWRQAVLYDRHYRDAWSGIDGARRLFCHPRLGQRHLFHDAADGRSALPMQERMHIWKAGSLEIGRQALAQALEGLEPAQVGSYIVVTSTGHEGQAPDLQLAEEMGLRRNLRRTTVGHMGCQAAFNGIKLALDALAARPAEAVVVQCTEISSAHFSRAGDSKEQVAAQALFGDASAALVLSADPAARGPRILRTHTEVIHAERQRLNLRLHDDGFRMTMSPALPAVLAAAVPGFVDRLLGPLGLGVADIACWGIHPGGPRIVESVAAALRLPPQATAVSLGVLADYGNCASATILLILERLLKQQAPAAGTHGVLVAFGPGLTLEAMVLRF